MTNGKSGKYWESSDDWKTTYVPRTIYFYHESQGKTRVYLWMNPDNDSIGPGAELKMHIANLTRNARNNGIDPRPIGKEFSDVPWWKRSYIVFASEETTFDDQAAVDIDHGGKENHCFFDGGEESFMVDGKFIHVMWTVNYMMDDKGKPLPPGHTQKFKWKFNPKRPPVVEEGSGTNMGPPIAPP